MRLFRHARSFSWKLLLLLSVFALYKEVDGNPTEEIVIKARCYANCISENPVDNKLEEPCKSLSCKDCLIPCGKSFADEKACKQDCKNSSSCFRSCEFLTRVKNFTSIFIGDGTISPTPDIPTVTNTTFTSISLEWEPIKNTSGTPIYMVEMAFSEDKRTFSSVYLSEVFITPNYTLNLGQLCLYIGRSLFGRQNYYPVLYKFRVAVVTENSSVSYGQQTMQTTLSKPDSVTNLTLDSFVYDAASTGDKVKLTASWIPSNEHQHLMTKFAMEVEPVNCPSGFFRRSSETNGLETTSSVYIYQKLVKCDLIIRVYSLIDCSAGDPTVLRFTYPGCQNVKDFPTSFCYEFDPPDAPIEDRIARNIRTSSPLTVQEDYRFEVTVMWDRPVYPFKDVQRYFVKLSKEREPTVFIFDKYGSTPNTNYSFGDLLPGTRYKIEVRVNFQGNRPSSDWNAINITTPGVDPDEVRVRNLTAGRFFPAPGGGSFLVNISWQRPTFNYSVLSEYIFSYTVGSRNNTGDITNTTHFIISGILHGEKMHYQVMPLYEHAWVQGKEAFAISRAPVPPDNDVRVKNIQVGQFVPQHENGTFSVNLSWTGPAFNLTFHSYEVVYELTGYTAEKPVITTVNKPTFYLSGIKPKEFLMLKVTPVFDNQYIPMVEEQITATAPEPNPNNIKVRNMTYKELNTSLVEQLDFLISWWRPLFQGTSVRKYAVTYTRSGNPDRMKLWNFKTAETSFPVYDLIPGDKVEVEVTAEFKASVITGIATKITITTPTPEDHEIQVRNLGAGVFIEDAETNTFSVIFSWQAPSFKHSSAKTYEVSYEFDGGYPRDDLSCSPLQRDNKGCSKTALNETSLQISGIFPREGISLKVTPIYSNKHITGIVETYRISAPEPKEELVKVMGLKFDRLVPGDNNTFGTTVMWEKPLFTHSEVKHYRYKVMSESVSPPVPQQRQPRATNINMAIETPDTNVTISGIDQNDSLQFQVTPVFVVSAVTGKNEKITLAWKGESDNSKAAVTNKNNKLSSAEIAGLILGLTVIAVIVLGLIVWNYRDKQKQRRKRGIVSGKNALMIDEWEVDGDLVTLEDELGEGAFGKVFKGTLREINTPLRKLSMMPPVNALRKGTLTQSTGLTVAVKMLHGMADSEQRREFLEEMQLMKAVGSHKNIVNMIGCCTVEEPMFLLTEYIPYGDLLHYLRKRRGKVKEYLGDESRGPYRSTYYETYVIDGRKPGAVSIQATKSDRIYVNTPDIQKDGSKDVQILSFTQKKNMEEEIGTENGGMIKDEGNDENEEGEDGLTPGDLLAFAWQICQGMEYLAKKGFVHRDLAARNILVGEHKVAKVADFGLTRHVYEEKVYHAKRNRKLPLKWMSIEAIFDQTFTTQSDVWAFGVVLWELVTLGGTPYPTINNRELLRLLKGGYRMEKPDICNEEIYGMMTKCWMESPDQRPNFTQIRERLEAMMQKDNPYLDFSVLDESREYYNVPSFNSLEEETSDDEKLDKDDTKASQETLIDAKEDENKSSENSNRNELTTIEESFKKLDKNGDKYDPARVTGFAFENNNLGGKDFRDLKDVKVNLEAIELSLYRPGNRAIVL